MDLEQSRIFLSAITSADPKDTQISFQTFDDDQARRDQKLATIRLGTLDKFEDFLLGMNKKKAGVFFAVNRVEGRRSIEAVKELRAAFIDCDNVEVDFESLALKPNIIVQSGRGAHAYWLLQRDQPLDRFSEIQKALAYKFGSDMKIHDLPRVMRLPGFLHQKKDPSLLVELVYCNTERLYTIDELFDGLGLEAPPEPERKAPKIHVVPESVRTYTIEEKLSRAKGLLTAIGPAVEGSNGHFTTLAAARVAHDLDIPDDVFLPLFLEWNRTCIPPWREEELVKYLNKSAPKYPRGGKLHDPRYQRYESAADIRVPDNTPWSESSAPPSRFAVMDRIPEDAPPIPPSIPLDAKPAGMRRGDGREAKSKKGDTKKRSKKDRKKRTSSDKRIGMGAAEILANNRPRYSDIDRDNLEASHVMNTEYYIAHEDSGQWYLYDGTKWVATSKFTMEKISMQYTTPEEFCTKYVNETLNRVRAKIHQKKIDWNQVGETEIPVLDGVLNFVTGEIRDHDPDNFLERIVPYSYNPDATCPTWHRCLEDWLPGKTEEKLAIQLFLGYCLMPHARYKKALMLWGKPHTGKSQICSVATELVGGTGYTCGILPSKMNDPRACAPIKGKALNVIPDLPKDQLIGDGGFKQMVSAGDTIQIDQKHLAPEQYTPTAKHIYATNNLPSINDPSSGVFERLMIIRFEHVIEEEDRDPQLEIKIKDEIEGILAWAVEGAKMLYEMNGRWPTVRSSLEAIEKYKLDENPVFDFIEESGKILKDEAGRISIEKFTDLFNDYHSGKTWTKKAVRARLEALGYQDCRMMVGVGKSKTKKRAIRGLVEVGEHLTLLDRLDEDAPAEGPDGE